MTTEESLADLWDYIEAARGRETASRLIAAWLHARIEHDEPVSPDLLYAIAEKRLDWPGDEHFTPKALTSFIGSLASLHPAQSVLDPTCGLGLLLHNVAASAGAQVVHGIDLNAECRDVAQAIFGNKATILLGDALASPVGLQSTYDLIVANPPFGMKVRGTPMLPHLGNDFRGDMGHALAVWACARLSGNGTAMLIVTPAFLWSAHGLEAQEAVRKCGFRVGALIHLPGGTFPHTGINTYLAVFERGEQREVFVGEFADSSEHQKSLIANYKRRKPGEQPALGRLCALQAFRGFDAFAAQERLKRLVRATGWPQHLAESVILKAERFSSLDEHAEGDPNGLCLRLVGQPVAVLDPDDLPRSAVRDSVRLTLDPRIVDDRYLVHWFNQSLVGQTTVASISQGGALSRLDLTALLKAVLCLPPLAEQRHVLQGIEHLSRVRAEATELETALWSCTEQTDVVVQQIRTINQEDRYEDWIETLPFPLASILWRQRAGGGSTREQYEVLLHFFEATAAFVATIHLSAFMTDDSLWREAAVGLRGSLTEHHLSLDRATFGAWRQTVEYLSGRCRKLLDDDAGLETCKRVYGTTNHRHIAMICHADLLTALQRANTIRNTSSHAGAIGQDEAQSIHDELLTLVQKIRGVFGRSWLGYELIQPSESRYQGGIYHYKAKRLMGTRSTPFEVVERASGLPLESDRLYLFDAMSQKGRLLLPFIRVMPSPEKKANACFIFSRCEKAGARFVSYHFDEESSLTASFPDVDEAFRRIHLFDDGAKL
jgi:methylase of polypeptide subunit release factors